MNNELKRTNNTPVIDYDTIIKKNSLIEKGASKGRDILNKLIKIRELCSKNNLYVQGMSMDDTLEEYYVNLKKLVNHLEDLNSQLTKAIYRSQNRQITKIPQDGGVKYEPRAPRPDRDYATAGVRAATPEYGNTNPRGNAFRGQPPPSPHASR